MAGSHLAHQQLVVVENETPSHDEALYDALLAALSSTARGRAFLEEYSRRVRAADTAAALAALARIEAMLARQEAAAAASAEVAEVREIDPDDAYVPSEFEPPPDSELRSCSPHEAKRNAGRATPDFASLHPGYEPVREDLLAQVMALSPEERIALFS